MWVFAGGPVRPVAAQSQSASILIEIEFCLLIEQNLFDRICIACIGAQMLSVKTIVTLASVAVIASSIFAVSWVGLALLGF
jgi:hypothetical protein